jgi:hypothetical protein
MLRHPDARKLTSASVISVHHFHIGAKVICDAPNGPLFEVTRLLPDAGSGRQYRIRSAIDGRERVVTETTLRAAPKTALLSSTSTYRGLH